MRAREILDPSQYGKAVCTPSFLVAYGLEASNSIDNKYRETLEQIPLVFESASRLPSAKLHASLFYDPNSPQYQENHDLRDECFR